MPPTNNQPTDGYFGDYGGRFVPDTLMAALDQLQREYRNAMADEAFLAEFDRCLREIAGRPSELYFAKRLTEHCGGARIYLKREDMNHTGAHKINNTLGQALLALRMGKQRVIAETGAGQHGVATATAAATRPSGSPKWLDESPCSTSRTWSWAQARSDAWPRSAPAT